MKRCRICKKIKSRSQFTRSVPSYCKPCMRKRARALRDRQINILQNCKRKLELLKAYGGRCKCCGERLFEFLTIDHIGNSKKVLNHRKDGNHNWKRRLKETNYPHKDKLRVLCFNCNCAIGLLGYCPHKSKIDDPMKSVLKFRNVIIKKRSKRRKGGEVD